MAEIWRCKGCGSGTTADDARLLLFLGWELLSLRNEGDAKVALCPTCAQREHRAEHDHPAQREQRAHRGHRSA